MILPFTSLEAAQHLADTLEARNPTESYTIKTVSRGPFEKLLSSELGEIGWLVVGPRDRKRAKGRVDRPVFGRIHGYGPGARWVSQVLEALGAAPKVDVTELARWQALIAPVRRGKVAEADRGTERVVVRLRHERVAELRELAGEESLSQLIDTMVQVAIEERRRRKAATGD